MKTSTKKHRQMTPYTFTKALNSFKKGDMGFCAIASMSTQNDHIINNIGFWFEVIENEESQPVMIVQMDSFTINKPVHSTIIAGKEQMHTYIKNVRVWAEKELTSLSALQE